MHAIRSRILFEEFSRSFFGLTVHNGQQHYYGRLGALGAVGALSPNLERVIKINILNAVH